jgi:hypothetical protein
MAGTGKRTQLHEALKKVAAIRGMPFSIQTKSLGATTATGDVAEAGATEGGAGPDDAEAGQMSMETSLIHIGLDIARMSMQDSLAALALLAEPGARPQIVRSGETSLEGLTRELLRPALADWLESEEFERYLRKTARDNGIPVARLRRKLEERNKP